MSGDFRLRGEWIDREYDTRGDDDTHHYIDYGMNFFANVDENISAFVRFAAYNANLEDLGATDTIIDEAYVDIKNFFELGDLRVGRQWMSLGHSIVLDDKMDGVKFSKIMDQVALTLFAFSTRTARNDNRQYYGNNAAAINSNFYMFDDTHKATDVAPIRGAAYVPKAPTAAITLYNKPFAGSRWEGYTGLQLPAATANHLWTEHAGLTLTNNTIGGLRLLPTDMAIDPKSDELLGVAIGTTPITYSDVALSAAADTATPANLKQAPAALVRGSNNVTANGLDSWGLNVSVDFGGHALAGYFMQREYDQFDPYTVLGDPWAAMCDVDGNPLNGIDAIAGTSHSADPSYYGITLDGNILRNVDYYLEYVNFDPDISNIGVNPLTGTATNAAGSAWNGNNMDEGAAWLVGIDWDLNDDLNLIIQYGVGDEEFIPASLNHEQYLNGMSGYRPEDLFYRNSLINNPFENVTDGGVGTGALTGIKDLLIKLSADFNEKTSGYIKFESVSENDSSAVRLISGDPMVTGHARQEYDLITVSFKHIYKPNTILRLQYDYLKYDSDEVNNSHAINGEAFVTDDLNGGGWSRVSADISVRF
jgi:hypothetical protein